MSHHFFSKKILCLLVATLIASGIFCYSVYVWLDHTDAYLKEVKLPVQEADAQEKELQDDYSAEAKVKEVLFSTKQSVDSLEKGWGFPCVIRIADNEIGVYGVEGNCVKKLKQVGEHLTKEDELLLRSGIRVSDEEELVMVMESYHLQ